MHTFGMNSLEDDPDESHFHPGSSDLDSLQHHQVAIKEVLKKFVDMSYCEEKDKEKHGGEDHVQEYASEVGVYINSLSLIHS